MLLKGKKTAFDINARTRAKMRETYPEIDDRMLIELVEECGIEGRDMTRFLPPEYFEGNSLLKEIELYIPTNLGTRIRFKMKYDIDLPHEISVYQVHGQEYAIKIMKGEDEAWKRVAIS